MQHFALSAPRALLDAAIGNRISIALLAGWQAYRVRRRLALTVRILEGLSDRELRDIGVERSEIQSIVATRCTGRRLQFDLDAVQLRG